MTSCRIPRTRARFSSRGDRVSPAVQCLTLGCEHTASLEPGGNGEPSNLCITILFPSLSRAVRASAGLEAFFLLPEASFAPHGSLSLLAYFNTCPSPHLPPELNLPPSHLCRLSPLSSRPDGCIWHSGPMISYLCSGPFVL